MQRDCINHLCTPFVNNYLQFIKPFRETKENSPIQLSENNIYLKGSPQTWQQ